MKPEPIEGRELLAIRARCARTDQGNSQSRKQIEADRLALMHEVYRQRDALKAAIDPARDVGTLNAAQHCGYGDDRWVWRGSGGLPVMPDWLRRREDSPVFGVVEQAREEITLDLLADLTADSDPWTAATNLYGGAR